MIIDPTDPRVLRIKKARIQDNGMYLCLARNKHGSVTTQSRVTIKRKSHYFWFAHWKKLIKTIPKLYENYTKTIVKNQMKTITFGF